jgi:hypothetical protein
MRTSCLQRERRVHTLTKCAGRYRGGSIGGGEVEVSIEAPDGIGSNGNQG